MTPKWIGWETVREIGSGSYGKVYEIQKNEDGKIRKAALKVISIPQSKEEIGEMYDSGVAVNEEDLLRYLDSIIEDLANEVHTMFSLQGCKNIVRYDDHRIVKHQGWPGVDIHIKMELLTPVKDMLPSVNPDEKLIIKLGMDICNALQFCHTHKPAILHRDIKPGNIMYDDQGNFKLGDFGVARTLDGTKSAHTRVGTEGYMAPEVLLQKMGYGPSADIYSLGIVLYRMLNNNRMPFMPTNGSITVKMQEEARLKRLKEKKIPMPLNGSDNLKRAILKAIDFYPENRYKDAAEFGEVLKKCLDGEDIEPAFFENKDDDQLTIKVSGGPSNISNGGSVNPGMNDPYGRMPNQGMNDPHGRMPNQGMNAPYGRMPNQGVNNPYGRMPNQGMNDPYGRMPNQGMNDPYGRMPNQGMNDPYGRMPNQGMNAPYGRMPNQGMNNPYGRGQGVSAGIQPDKYSNNNQNNGGKRSKLPIIIIAIIAVVLIAGAAIWFFLLKDDKSDESVTREEIVTEAAEEIPEAEAEEVEIREETEEIPTVMAEEVEALPESTDNQPEEIAYRPQDNDFSNAQVGDIVLFGFYEQDNNLSNDKEDIEWIVLDRKSDKLLLVSRYGLDCKPYNEVSAGAYWEISSVREWLNGEFLNESFGAHQSSRILKAQVSADANPKYDTSPGNTTMDRVFIFSIDGVKIFMDSTELLQCKPTAYALSKGAIETKDSGCCRWWLRTPGKENNTVTVINTDGTICYEGLAAGTDDVVIRPAIWVKLDN